MTSFDRSYRSSYWHSTVTMAASCIIFDIKRDICRKLRLFHSTTPVLDPGRNFSITIGVENLINVVTH